MSKCSLKTNRDLLLPFEPVQGNWFCRWLIYQEFVLKGTGVKSFFQEFSPGGDQN